jgi:HD superfamily phosphohydrolase
MIVNDTLYGVIDLRESLVLELLEHPYFQRLRRVSQLGLVQLVYPTATHSRFSHTVGALYLMQEALKVLLDKGIAISPAEQEAVCIAILLHDVGHSPFSHSLEFKLLDIHHEEISIALMEQLNEQFGGRLSLAIQIFKNQYPKKFLYQLVSGQLDMDRLDYLNRDSYFTGVREGKVGYERILKMLYVVDDSLVVEFKGIYSVENFLIARRLMYWQVYLHKAGICAGEMLTKVLERARYLATQKGEKWEHLPVSLQYFLFNQFNAQDLTDKTKSANILLHFTNLDDTDIWYALKIFAQNSDICLAYLAKGILERKLLKTEQQNHSFSRDHIENLRLINRQKFNISEQAAKNLVFTVKHANRAYNLNQQAILIYLGKDKAVRPITDWKEHNIQPKEVVKYYLCYPKTAQDLAENDPNFL